MNDEDLRRKYQIAQMSFKKGKTLSYEFRIQQLKKISSMLNLYEKDFISTLATDLNKPKFESIIAEIEFAKNDITTQIINLKKNMANQNKDKDLVSFFDGVYVKYDPKGVVLIFSTWNYPIMCSLCPLIGAIAAGNCVILKCSELALATGQLIEKLCKAFLDDECYFVVNGGIEVSKNLLEYRFDHIFFTGSKNVGKLIYQKAAEKFTTVTLELGGKSPVYFDESISEKNMEFACKRLIWGKMVNSGQTCVAPDYILLHKNIHKLFVETFVKVCNQSFYKKFYDKTLKCYNLDLLNEDKDGIPIDSIGQLLNKQHFLKLSNLLNKTNGNIIFGGQIDENKNRIFLTLVDNCKMDDILMEEEIFGPILPIISVNDKHDAILKIKSLERPLALYIFSENNFVIENILSNTTSGSVCINDCILQLNVDSLPFGGVGESGIGNYHGKYSFETFSHQKAILKRNFNPILEWVASKRYPPYKMSNLIRLKRITTKRYIPIDMNCMKAFFYIVFGFLLYFLFDKIVTNYSKYLTKSL